MKIEIDAAGLERVQERLDRIADSADGLRPAFHRISDIMLAAGRRRFATGPGWPPLADSTRAKKRQRGEPTRPLVATGRLLAALTTRGAPGQELEITRDRLTFGLEPSGLAYYGKFHQQGRGVPMRKIIDVDRRTRDDVVDEIRDTLLGSRR